jgi:hypothetical protein
MAGTSILLGLIPTILSVLGFSVAKMALLHIQRPLLSVLLSLGTPADYPERFLIWKDPLRANEPHTGARVIRAFPHEMGYPYLCRSVNSCTRRYRFERL